METCSKCGSADNEFTKPRPGRRPVCRPCDNRIQRESRYDRLGRRRCVGEVEVFACESCSVTFERTVTPGKQRVRCDECLRDAFNARARDKWRGGYLRRTYGITVAAYDQMVTDQGGRCAICGTDRPGGRHDLLVVDHCHTTGAVRGLLCNACNIGIGNLRDDPAVLASAIAYLSASRVSAVA